MSSAALSRARRGGAARSALPFLLILALLLLALPTVAWGQSASGRVDPRVLADTASGQTASVLLLLSEQADLEGAADLPEKGARNRYVFEALREVASRTQPAVTTELERMGLPYRAFWIVNALVVEADRAAIEQLARLPAVRRIEPNRAIRALDPSERPTPAVARETGSVEWGVERVRAPEVWAMGYRGEGIVIGNQDTGIQWDHPALIEHYRGWDGESASHDYNWWDAIHADVGGGGNPCGFSTVAPCDDHGHGTHTAGIAVGGDAGNQIGVAPGAKWIGCRNMEQGDGRPESYMECFQFFLAPTDSQGENPDPSKAADIVSNSWSCPPSEGCEVDTLQLTVEAMRAAGIMVIVSSGNSGPSCGSVSAPPSFYDAATTVGSTGQNDNIAANSSRGPAMVDGSQRLKPDLVAPGVGIRSSYPTNSYVSISGTSMAAPHVAGAVALLWSARPELHGDIEATEQLLFGAAVELTTGDGCGGLGPTAVPNNTYGWGRLDVYAAITSGGQAYYLPLLAAPNSGR